MHSLYQQKKYLKGKGFLLLLTYLFHYKKWELSDLTAPFSLLCLQPPTLVYIQDELFGISNEPKAKNCRGLMENGPQHRFWWCQIKKSCSDSLWDSLSKSLSMDSSSHCTTLLKYLMTFVLFLFFYPCLCSSFSFSVFFNNLYPNPRSFSGMFGLCPGYSLYFFRSGTKPLAIFRL